MANVKEQLAKHSSDIGATTWTYPSAQDLLDDIDQRPPRSTMTVGWKLNRLNEGLRRVWRYMASTKGYSFTSTDDRAVYDVPNDCRFEKIRTIMRTTSTSPGSSDSWVEYNAAYEDESLGAYSYYKAGGGIGIYPVPTSDDHHHFYMRYEAVPTAYTTGNTTTILGVNPEHADILKDYVLRELSFAMPAPDVELGNNYDMSFKEKLRDIKMEYQKSKRNQKRREDYNWNKGWWKG